ncbi:stretch-activated Ca2+-permeable channel component-domain-containing protein [Phaeosphaeriaceae sp. PMI808]|nr:stretch-activated Ca2+-permeable channel component-domain-containing protein [Phaeosphaeriaceae sp. PMI808]
MLSPIVNPAQSRLLPSIIATYLLLLLTVGTSSQPRFLAHAVQVPGTSDSDALTQFEHGARDKDGPGGYSPDFDYFDRSLLGRQEPQSPQVMELTNNAKKDMDINPGVTTYFIIKRGRSRAVRTDEVASRALDAQGLDVASEKAAGEHVTPTEEEVDIDNGDSELSKRQTGNQVWISATTCRQPVANRTESMKNHPQLVMFVSDSPQNQKPGPDSTDGLRTPPTGLLFEEGFANFSLSTNSDIYIGISAPNLDRGLFGSWQFEIAASFDGPYHSYNNSSPFLFMIDTDSESALFITYSLAEWNSTDANKWKENNPFRMYAFPLGDTSPITGMERSLCALQGLSNNPTNSSASNSTSNSTNNSTRHVVSTSITNKIGDNSTKGQFHVQGLENGKTYNGFLIVEGAQKTLQIPGTNDVVRGGGLVFQKFNWTTKNDDTCQVLFDLEFCDSVAYAVPSSPEHKLDDEKLRALYDNKAKAYYKNFKNSLAQMACDTNPESQYSLARTCKDCERDYKNWLCSVLIPRCEDWSAPGAWLQERNVNAALPDGSLTFGNNLTAEMNSTKRDRLGYNSTRNPGIDLVTPEGPYKEMLPCEDLCYEIVKSCPAKLGFSCPNSPARELTYGQRDPRNEELFCNFPGAVVKLNVKGVASGLGVRVSRAVVFAVLASAMVWA